MAPATPSRHGFFDECSRGPIQFSLGFMKPSASFPFGHVGAFGFPGAGGSMGFADPEAGIGYGYVTNRMGMHLHGDPRDVALRAALQTMDDDPRSRRGARRSFASLAQWRSSSPATVRQNEIAAVGGCGPHSDGVVEVLSQRRISPSV
jgi:CubicO group peptidase (beta-lactamase class C family)